MIDGLAGQWLSLEELGQLDLFQGGKRAFKVKLNTNFGVTPGRSEPGIKAAVRREYAPGALICEAGDYGSTAFLLLEGRAVSALSESAHPRPIRGARERGIKRLQRLFGRLAGAASEPDEIDVGEISRYASISSERPLPQSLGPGDLFGVDTCLNFFPREATVRAETACVVIEILRSVLDSLREAGDGGARVDASYRASAIRNQLQLSHLFRVLSDEQHETIAATAQLLTPKSETVRDNLIYARGDSADSVYLVRSGTIQIGQDGAVSAYLGRGTVFGLEGVADLGAAAALQLRCVSHPEQFATIAVGTGLSLGRSADCEVVFPAEQRAIGRHHCRIEVRASELFLIDLGSANFTLLNGDRCREALVTAGDRISVVDYSFELVRPTSSNKEELGGDQKRSATASGLDNFEIIAIPKATLRQAAAGNPRFATALAAIARELSATLQPPPRQRALAAELVDLNLYNSQNTLLIDLDRCTRCDQCVRACASSHDGVARFTRDGPRFGNYLVTMACRSCTDPQCMIGCPVGSIRRQGSLEVKIEDWCIGCERCANQCPFGNINLVELTASVSQPPATAASATAASAPIQLRATVCDLCAGYDGPNCVYACPHEAAIRVNPQTFLSLVDPPR